jgi:molybdenum cofactor guanylyltransferase
MIINTIILAGGKSSRMGRDKALIPIQAIPMLELIYNIAANISNQIYIVTPWQEKYQHLQLPNCQFIKEEKVDAGPLIAFSQGLTAVKSEWVMLLACDLPKLKVDVLKSWVNQLEGINENINPQYIAALVKSEKGWQPLCGFYRSSCLGLLSYFISQGGNSFQGWLEGNYVYNLPLLDDDILFNCNTPQDLDFGEI